MQNVNDFLSNPEFVRWVKNPDPELDKYWARWLESNPEAKNELLFAKEVVLRLRIHPINTPAGLRDSVLSRILKESTNDSRNKTQTQPEEILVRHNFWDRFGQFQRVAAILILFFGIGALLNIRFFTPEKLPVVEELTWTEKRANFGEKLNFVLPDGSRVWLNSGSSVRYASNYNVEERQIVLAGEGFFEVQKDKARPFKVISNSVETVALGTSFNIRMRDEESIDVSLLTGLVEVSYAENSKIDQLRPGQSLSINVEKEEALKSEFDLIKILAWKEGRIIFENASFSEVKLVLEKWYGVNIEVTGNKNPVWNFSGEYQNQTLENLLNSVSYVENFKYELSGKNVKIKI